MANVYTRYPSILTIGDASGNLATVTAGALNVNVTGSSLDVGVADKTAFVYGTSVEQPIGGVYQDTSPTLTAGTTGAVRLTAYRGFHVNLRNATGDELLGQQLAANSIPVVFASDIGVVTNVTQFGSNNVVTGTGVSGLGIPRVTVASDSSITANAGTNLNTSLLALDTSVNGILLAQGSSTSGKTGPLIQGAVTTAAPSYTTAQNNPLSLTTSGSLRVDGSGSTQPVSGTVAVTQSTSPWVTSDQGFSKANTPVNNIYSSTNITTAAYVQLVASTTSTTKEIEIFDSSGQSLYLAVGAAASEVDQMIIFPGGNGRVKLQIPSGSRVSAKAISGTASTGNLYINFYG